MRLVWASVLWAVNGLAWLVLGLSLSAADPSPLVGAAVVVLGATYGFASLIVPRRESAAARGIQVAPASPELVRALERAGVGPA